MTAYFDNASTTAVCREAADKSLEMMTDNYANPSSLHAAGRRAKEALEEARRVTAGALGAAPGELFFTSGGTESNNRAVIFGALGAARRGKHIISSKAEHDSVLKAVDLLESRGFEVTRLSPERDGSIAPQAVEEAIRKDTALISLMLVNNETGAITDIAAVSEALKRLSSQALLHTDAVQAFLKIPFSAADLGADLISVSGHKVHAPKGVGALFARKGVSLPPMLVGGEQENSKRAGTEATPMICAFGEAVRVGAGSFVEDARRMRELRGLAESRLKGEIPGLIVTGGGAPHILCVSLPGHKSETLMNFLESKGVYVSKSSACKKGGRSHVLEAIGLPGKVIDGSLRISFSRRSGRGETDYLCDRLKEADESLITCLS